MDTKNLLASALLDGRRLKPAVFALEHRSGRRLIVGTKCLSKRLYDQRRYLACGRHHNAEVQADLMADGAEAFSLIVLDLVPEEPLLPYFKRLHVAAAQQGKGTYNPAEPPSRRLVAVECPLKMSDSTTDLLTKAGIASARHAGNL